MNLAAKAYAINPKSFSRSKQDELSVVHDELVALINGRPVTKELLFELVPKLNLTTRISAKKTKNFSLFFSGGVRYFFTVYANDRAYRICMDDVYANLKDAKCDGYIGFIGQELSEIDDYTRQEGDYECKDGVEILTYLKPVIKKTPCLEEEYFECNLAKPADLTKDKDD